MLSHTANRLFWRYYIHGLTVASELQCPELRASSREPDVIVRYGPVPVELDDPAVRGAVHQVAGDRCLLDLTAIAGARFLIQNGNEIVVDREEGARDSMIRLYLLGSCIATALFQRGLLPLHGSSVSMPQGAVLFAGHSTSGKSTLATAFHQRSYPILADDVSTISFTPDGLPVVTPELKQLKLWAQTLQHFGVEASALEPVGNEPDKYGYPLGDSFATEPAPLHTVYFLHPYEGRAITFCSPSGMKKVSALQGAVYRGEYLPDTRYQASCFPQLVRLAETVRLREMVYPHDLSRLTELVERIEEDVQS
jgi:hypothetical protein